MKEGFYSSKADTLALATGLLLVIIIVAAYALGVTSAAQDLETALNPDRALAPLPVYNLDAASKLNLKGLTPGR